jgi:hypothetical protein
MRRGHWLSRIFGAGAGSRGGRRRTVLRATYNAAYSPLDDEAAFQKLSARFGSERDVVAETFRKYALLHKRDEYIHDRVCRLMAALMEGHAVEPVAAHNEELFDREEAIGRMPIRLAFQQLADKQPGLQDLARQAQTLSTGPEDGNGRLPNKITTGIREALDDGATTSLGPIGKDLAMSVVHSYLAMLTGNLPGGSPDTPYFDGRKMVVMTGELGRRTTDSPR